MPDPIDFILRSDTADEFVLAMNRVSPLLPRELWKPFTRAKMACLQAYGIEGTYSKLNGMTVKEILSHFDDMQEPNVIARGSIEGMTYELIAPPEDRAPSPDVE